MRNTFIKLNEDGYKCEALMSLKNWCGTEYSLMSLKTI